MAGTVDGGEVRFEFTGDTTALSRAIAETQTELDGLASTADDVDDAVGGAGGALSGMSAGLSSAKSSGKQAATVMSGLALGLAKISPNASKALRSMSGLARAAVGLGAAAGASGAAGGVAAMSGALVAAAPVVIAAAAAYGVYRLALSEVEEQLAAANAQQERANRLAGDQLSAVAALNATVDDVLQRYGEWSGAINTTDQQIDEFNRNIDAQTEAVIRNSAANAENSAQQLKIADQLRARAAAAKEANAEILRAEEAERAAAEASRAASADAAAQRQQEAAAAAAAAADRKADLEQQQKLAAEWKRSLNELIAPLNVVESQMAELQPQLAAVGEQIVETTENTMMSIERSRAATMDAIASTLGSAQTLARIASEKAAKDDAKAAKRRFRLAQTFGIGQAAINTAVGITTVLANPFLGPGAKIAGMIAAGAAGAAQTAVILSQKPPVEHIGTGMLGSSDPLAPDEIIRGNRRTLQSEATINSQGTNALGPQGVEDLNNGRMPEPPTVNVLLSGRALDSKIGKFARTNTRTGRAMNSQRRRSGGRGGW